MGFDKGVTDENSVFLADKNLILRENHTSYTVGHAWHVLTIELADILVACRRVYAALIAVYAKVERSSMLNHCLVETRQHHMRFIVHTFDRNHQQTMLFTCVASYQSGAMICTGLIGTQHLLSKRLVQVYEQVLIKFKITHMFKVYMDII